VQKLIKFKELGLSDEILKALNSKGFEEPSPIQQLCIPPLLKGEKDVIGQAQTGTGKTAAFSLPIIEILDTNTKTVGALVLAPTRELVIQVAEEINSLRGNKKLTVFPIYGGVDISRQMRKLKEGVDIVVGTPGRVQDLINRKKLILSDLKFFILDEADEMLNMGFLEDIENILKHTGEDKRMLFFSATMPREILSVAKTYMRDYEVLAVKKTELTTDLTEQIYFEVSRDDKFEALSRVIDIENDFYGIIFGKTKNEVDAVARHLIDRGYDADCIHGDVSQNQREKVLSKFKNKRINVLVATDVAARGIDVNNLTHVINYSIPQDPESYVHRIGRTGRAGNEGTAITFVTPSEYRKLLHIQRIAKTEIRKQKVPKIKEILRKKEEAIVGDIESIVETGEYNDYMTLAEKIVGEKDPKAVLAALLKKSFGEELDASNYNEIVERNRRDRDRGRDRGRAGIEKELNDHTRLFIARGKKDGMNPGKLVGLLSAKARVRRNNLKNVSVFDTFSFATVLSKEAET
jgi:ATP-dependent RNA helicase DeaD